MMPASTVAFASASLVDCFMGKLPGLFKSFLSFLFQIHFLMVISANITHLKETRFATLNAYEETEEVQNSKHVVDTTM